jgi:endonuclease YncB( thermonuclease family)
MQVSPDSEMMAKSKPKTSWFTVLLITTAVALWAYNESQVPEQTKPETSRTRQTNTVPAGPAARTGAYETYQGCTLVEARGNDGDSFLVKLPDGRKAEFRLYFVDAPESAFRTYSGGDTNHRRIQDQAADLGGITPQQAVEIGKKAKAFTSGALSSRPFALHTRWDSPFNDNRFHAFVEIDHHGGSRWLHEVLVESGLVRIHTKGADLPDGTPSVKHKTRLQELQAAARKSAAGAWGL